MSHRLDHLQPLQFEQTICQPIAPSPLAKPIQIIINNYEEKLVGFIFGSHRSEFAAEAEIAVLCFHPAQYVVTAMLIEQKNLDFEAPGRKADPAPRREVVDFNPYPTYAAPAFLPIHKV